MQTRERKAALKTIADLIADAQTAFNAFVRERDKDKGCFVCGRPFEPVQGRRQHAGHVRSRGAAGHLRFHEDNCMGECEGCNGPHECQARQYGDQMICAACGLNWDTNDPEPPECRKVDRRTKKAREAAAGPWRALWTHPARRRLPDELPPDVAAEMVKTYQANARDGLRGQIAGMQAAYRLFLDRVEL